MNFLIEPIFYNWLIVGTVLLIIEVTSFTLLFFWLSIAAFIMAAISKLMPDLSLTTHLWSFAIISIACVVIWHRLFKKNQEKLGDNRINNRSGRYIGQTAIVSEAIVNGQGRIKIEDSFWRVQCQQDLAVGSIVEIIAADGIVLQVQAKA